MDGVCAYLLSGSQQALGIAAASLDCAVKYSMERESFGRPICDLYAIQVFVSIVASSPEVMRMGRKNERFLRKKEDIWIMPSY